MIDPEQPPPGWRHASVDGPRVMRNPTTWTTIDRSEAHRIYAAESRPAVIDFAERIASWLESFDGPQADVIHEIAGIILAAARGERALP